MARPTPEQMKKVRTNCMLTMREVAEQTGLSLNTVWNSENHKRQSRIATLRTLIRFYELQDGRNKATESVLQKLGAIEMDDTPSSQSSKPQSFGRSV